jgi:ATP-dependent Lon protease
MFPMPFDHRLLATLPLPGEDRIQDIVRLLHAIVVRRILPDFRSKRGTDALKLSRLMEFLRIVRMEDEANRLNTVSAIRRAEGVWTIFIHERIFDYFSFVIPSDPESRLGSGPADEKKMLAFAEFLLRHEVELALYPDRSEREVIAADAEFALERRSDDPTYYRMLRSALSDEMNGLKGAHYLALLDLAEQGLSLEPPIGAILGELVASLAAFPLAFLQRTFPDLDGEVKSRLITECYRQSRDSGQSLLHRTHSLRAALKLLALLMSSDKTAALEVFQTFRDRWGNVELFRELEIPESVVDGSSPDELVNLFNEALRTHLDEDAVPLPPKPPVAVPVQHGKIIEKAEKSLKDRIEEARNNPAIPLQVIDTIDKNKVNATGHSGSKYSELIETLLAVPWGRIKKITVTPQDFEAGLDRSHYGIQTPKELICDFFSNLIWRYQRFSEAEAGTWKRTGSAFLLVGPPGVGKTSLAISIAQHLDIPYHKLSLGGMRDEADLRGHSFTYEGSKPGAIVQGLIKMQVMNGMFILDEADKTEKFAIATLLEILDPEQNHLFHDKYTQTTVDIDLSNCHFFLTANTLDGVPPVVVNRCEVVHLDQYSIEEKVEIARRHLIQRLREKYQIDARQIDFHPGEAADLLRFLIRAYTYEPGVRELERVIRQLFLRIQRREILADGAGSFIITREAIKTYLKPPTPPRQISSDDAVGEMLALGVDVDRGIGSIIPIQATRMGEGSEDSPRGFLSIVHATGNIEKVMDESWKVATTGVFSCAEALGIDLKEVEEPVHLHFMGGSTRKDGPSAGGAIALALLSLLSGRPIRRDVAMTGEIDTKGRISGVGALALKIETAHSAGCKTVILPRENLFGEGGIERFPPALKEELQVLTYEEWRTDHKPFDYSRHVIEVVAVDNLVQAATIACLDDRELNPLITAFEEYGHTVGRLLRGRAVDPGPTEVILQIKNPGEIDGKFVREVLEKEALGLHFLGQQGDREAFSQSWGMEGKRCDIIEFNPKQETLHAVVEDILHRRVGVGVPPTRLALIAPFFFLKRDGIRPDQFSSDPRLQSVVVFANNYAAQAVKIKNSKSILNRVWSILAQLDPGDLESCPFLARVEDVFVVDLAFIPEKYRLDLQRAENILHRTLSHWLAAVERSLTGAGEVRP